MFDKLKAIFIAVVLTGGVVQTAAAGDCSGGVVIFGQNNSCSGFLGGGSEGSIQRPSFTGSDGGMIGDGVAVCRNGSWDLSNVTCSFHLDAPKRFTASDGTKPGAIYLNWDNVTGAHGYNIRYRKQGTSDWTEVKVGINFEWYFYTTEQSVFEFQIQAVNPSGVSDFSSDTGYIIKGCLGNVFNWGDGNFCSATTPMTSLDGRISITNIVPGAIGSATAVCNSNGSWQLLSPSCSVSLPAPTTVNATDGTLAGKVQVTWGAVSGASDYVLQYRKQGANDWTQVQVTGTNWEHVISDESTFEYQIQAKNVLGSGNWSGSDTGYVARSCASQSFGWGAGNFCQANANQTASGQTVTLTNVAAGASGIVRAVCTNGSWSVNNPSCSANLAATIGVSATDGTLEGKVAVTWSAVPGASSYVLQYRKQGSSTWTTVDPATSGWEHVTSDESTFEYQVQAKNVLGVGSWSATDTGYITPSCSAQAMNWGPSGFCAASAPKSIWGSNVTLTNTTTGASGSLKASCVGGAWQVSNDSCQVAMNGPTTLNATDGTLEGKVAVTWSAVPGASSYVLQYRKQGSSTWTTVDPATSGWEHVTSDESIFEYQVQGRNVVGDGATKMDTGFIAQSCNSVQLKWGTDNACGATPMKMPSGSSVSLTNTLKGLNGSAKATCNGVQGKWELSQTECSMPLVNAVDASDGTYEDLVRIQWAPPINDGTQYIYDVFRGVEKIASGLKATSFDDVPPERATVYSYKVVAKLQSYSNEGSDTGFVPACRAARLIGASLNADMSAINGLIERWECLSGLDATQATDASSPAGLALAGERVYRSFSVPVSADLKDGAHILHLGLQSGGVNLNANRIYDVPFNLDRSSIAVKSLSIIYNGTQAVDGLQADSIGRFGIRMDGGSGIGFAEEVK